MTLCVFMFCVYVLVFFDFITFFVVFLFYGGSVFFVLFHLSLFLFYFMCCGIFCFGGFYACFVETY